MWGARHCQNLPCQDLSRVEKTKMQISVGRMKLDGRSFRMLRVSVVTLHHAWTARKVRMSTSRASNHLEVKSRGRWRRLHHMPWSAHFKRLGPPLQASARHSCSTWLIRWVLASGRRRILVLTVVRESATQLNESDFFGPPAFGLRLRGSSGQGIYLSA